MKRQKQIRSNWMFYICAAVTASAGLLGLVNTKPVLAAESVGEEMVVSDTAAAADIGAAGELSENASNTGGNENLGVYDFKDNKTTGTVTVTKVWDDNKTNEEREIPDIKISTAKPSKSALGYTVTFHGNKAAGLVFDDGSDVNEVVYNSSRQIVDGVFKVPRGWTADAVTWFTDEALTNKVDVSKDGAVQMTLSGDVDLWGKVKTFEIKGYNGNSSRKYNDFNYLIPDTVTKILFTDEMKPVEAEIIDVDADGDGGVVAWTENNGATMKISTQIKGMKGQAAKNSGDMFYNRSKLTNIDFSMLDTQNVTDMGSMFFGCSGLTALDLSSFDTQNVTNMDGMFSWCSGLTTLDLSTFDTQNVTNMNSMFFGCSGLTSIITGPNFKFAGTSYAISGTWQNTAGETFTSGNFPSNVADTYTKIK